MLTPLLIHFVKCVSRLVSRTVYIHDPLVESCYYVTGTSGIILALDIRFVNYLFTVSYPSSFSPVSLKTKKLYLPLHWD